MPPGLVGQVRMYGRYALGLPRFLRNPITLADAEAMVQRGIEEREPRFVRLLERGVFPYPESPYARLLRMARCELGDLREMVQRHGLAHTLRALREAGVYITFEELKGREPVVRNGEAFPVARGGFDNPLLKRGYEAHSGGTTGVGTRVSTDLDHLAEQSAHLMLAYHAHGVLEAPHAIWRGVLPDGSGINNVLRGSHHGRVPARWFSPNRPDDPAPALRFRMATYGTVLIGRLCGVPIPWPEMVPIEQAIVVARWAAETVRRHGKCQVNAAVSRALRVAIAAKDAGLDLTGVVFVIAGEPPSPAKVAGIRSSGAECFTTYGFVEGGRVAIGCANPVSENDLHILRDAFEVMPFERTVPGADITVPALNITSLLPTAPQILINAEIDDYGVVEERRCGCPLDRLGYHLHVRDVHSYRKLTGEGGTLIGSEMIDILERVLPARFGGSALDYQLMEEEDERGLTRLSLIVSPRIAVADERELVEAIYDGLHTSSTMADVTRNLWAQAGTLRVKREEPRWTARGKLLPLHLARRVPRGPAAS